MLAVLQALAEADPSSHYAEMSGAVLMNAIGPARDQLGILIDEYAPAHGRRGILFAPARAIHADTVNQMARLGRSVIACCVSADRAHDLGLETMRGGIERSGNPRFLVSVEAAACDGTGISAADRAQTLRDLGDPSAAAADLVTPGHIMPCLPPSDRDQILLHRALEMAETQSGVAAVAWCDIVNERGNVGSLDYCEELGDRFGLRVRHASTSIRPALFSAPRLVGA
jgi:3,4-dihydroxy 2-butanone 4-phosphate synthase/GTP cyclohydrolase II